MTSLPSVACTLAILLRVAFAAAGGMSRRRVQQAASRDTCPADQDLRPVLDNALRLPLPQLLDRMLKQSTGQADSYPLQLIVLDDDADDTVVLEDGSVWKPYREVDEVKAAGEYMGGLPEAKDLSPDVDDNAAIDIGRALVLPVLEQELQANVFEGEDAIDKAGVDPGARELGDFETDRGSAPQSPQQVTTAPLIDAAIQPRPDLAQNLREMRPETAEDCEQESANALLPDLVQDAIRPGPAQPLPEIPRTPQNEGNACVPQENQAETVPSRLGSSPSDDADLPGPLQQDVSSELQTSSKISSDADDIEQVSNLAVNRACSPEAGAVAIADSKSRLEDSTSGTSHVEHNPEHRKPFAGNLAKVPVRLLRASTSVKSGDTGLRARLAAAVKSQLSQTEPSTSLASAGTQTAANGTAAPWYMFHGNRQKQLAAALSAFFVLLYFYLCYALVAWAKEFYEMDIREDLDFL